MDQISYPLCLLHSSSHLVSELFSSCFSSPQTLIVCGGSQLLQQILWDKFQWHCYYCSPNRTWSLSYSFLDQIDIQLNCSVCVLSFCISTRPGCLQLRVTGLLGDAQYWGWEIDNGGKQEVKVRSCKTILSNK
jgi:hypothetical protein